MPGTTLSAGPFCFLAISKVRFIALLKTSSERPTASYVSSAFVQSGFFICSQAGLFGGG
jgi:hypothetical protein